ncbi:MAG: hypothetical protein J6Q89_07630 [Clostridia bacterium]|nr:hypothetical protein [Clostridia bacterium]
MNTYQKKKEELRQQALEWQAHLADVPQSWLDVMQAGDYFSENGRKYGLLREFRENGIC